ncbi:HD domain-containing protein [soil metagenome]
MRAQMHSDLLPQIERFVAVTLKGNRDPAHDLSHIHRVVASATVLAREEKAEASVVLPAAWLHDIVVLPKSAPDRASASRMAAETATEFLHSIEYPKELIGSIAHAITVHSFSAGIEPETIEAKVLQDADRLDALGAIGIARMFATAGVMGSALLSPNDPFAEKRPLDDRRYAVDHFEVKLMRLASSMRTDAGKREADRRTEFMRAYMRQLRLEMTPRK